MRILLWSLAGLIVAGLIVLAGVLAFDAPVKPPPLASIADPFATVDFRDLPAVQTYRAATARNSVIGPTMAGARKWRC
jgi:hypothetical protein